jgi:tetratricopeptide (TPR) repeat protein
LQVALDELDHLAEQLDDDARRSEAADRRARFLHESGRAEEALAVAERAFALAPAQAPHLAARAGVVILEALGRLGRYAQSRQRSAAIIALAGRAPDEAVEGRIFNALGMQADDQGDTSAAAELYQNALERHRESGNRSHEAAVLSNIGYADLVLGNYEAAHLRFEQAREVFARIGQRDKQGIVLINLALVALNQGDALQAQAHARAALPLLLGAGSRWAAAAARRVLGQAGLALGQPAEAAALLAAARDEFAALGLPHLAMEASAYLAQAALAQGDGAGAAAHARSVLRQIEQGGSVDGTEEPLKMLLACWQALDQAGDEAAAAVLAQAHAQLLERAARIGAAEQRESFLLRVPHHHALLQAWQHASAD